MNTNRMAMQVIAHGTFAIAVDSRFRGNDVQEGFRVPSATSDYLSDGFGISLNALSSDR
jgi:hypothetical protein